jgi:hypothetical protein
VSASSPAARQRPAHAADQGDVDEDQGQHLALGHKPQPGFNKFGSQPAAAKRFQPWRLGSGRDLPGLIHKRTAKRRRCALQVYFTQAGRALDQLAPRARWRAFAVQRNCVYPVCQLVEETFSVCLSNSLPLHTCNTGSNLALYNGVQRILLRSIRKSPARSSE